jgi:hypothetical protein
VSFEIETPNPLTPDEVSAIESRIESRLNRAVNLAVRVILVTEVHGTAPMPVPTATAGGG